MRDAFNLEILLPPREPDTYAQYFYDHLNPLSHLDAYAHASDINFLRGEQDTHVPPDGAFPFQSSFQEMFPIAADHVQGD